LRTAVFCKGALETVKKFGWPPDIIHCSGWMTGLIPMFIKVAYKKEPVFNNCKVVYTVGQNTFKEKLGADFLKLAAINDNVTKKELDFFKDVNNTSMFRGGAAFADAITFGAAKPEKKLVEEFSKVKGKKTLPFNAESDLTDYLQLYTDLAK
jgi:starch synthase